MNHTIKIIAATASAILVLGVTGCEKKKASAKANSDSAEQMFAVGTYVISEGNLDDYLEFGGDVVSVNAIAVLPDMAGRISEMPYESGIPYCQSRS